MCLLIHAGIDDVQFWDKGGHRLFEWLAHFTGNFIEFHEIKSCSYYQVIIRPHSSNMVFCLPFRKRAPMLILTVAQHDVKYVLFDFIHWVIGICINWKIFGLEPSIRNPNIMKTISNGYSNKLHWYSFESAVFLFWERWITELNIYGIG